MSGALTMSAIEEAGAFGLRMPEIESIGWDPVLGGPVLAIVTLHWGY